MIKKFVSKNYFRFKSYIYIFLNPEMRYDLRELVFALSLFICFRWIVAVCLHELVIALLICFCWMVAVCGLWKEEHLGGGPIQGELRPNGGTVPDGGEKERCGLPLLQAGGPVQGAQGHAQEGLSCGHHMTRSHDSLNRGHMIRLTDDTCKLCLICKRNEQRWC